MLEHQVEFSFLLRPNLKDQKQIKPRLDKDGKLIG